MKQKVKKKKVLKPKSIKSIKGYQVVNIYTGNQRARTRTKSKSVGSSGATTSNTTSIVNNVYPNTLNNSEERLLKRNEMFNEMNKLQREQTPITNPQAQQLKNHELTNYRINKPNPYYYDRDITQRVNEPLPNKTKSIYDTIKGGASNSLGVVKDSAKIIGVAGLATLGGLIANRVAGGGVGGSIAQNATSSAISGGLGGSRPSTPRTAPVIAQDNQTLPFQQLPLRQTTLPQFLNRPIPVYPSYPQSIENLQQQLQDRNADFRLPLPRQVGERNPPITPPQDDIQARK